jgi:beta-lactamase regulating signal transducer with metallopeptidase domain
MSLLTASLFLKTLGWALLNSCWQFAVGWLIYQLCTTGRGGFSAAARHRVALLLLLAGSACFAITFVRAYYAAAAGATIYANDFSAAGNGGFQLVGDSIGSALNTAMPFASVVYLFCLIFLGSKFLICVQRAGTLQKSQQTRMSASWRIYINNIAVQLGIRQKVKAVLSTTIDTPQVIGFLKPVLLLPAACITSLTTAQLEAVLLHELVHIKRNDYLVNLFVTSIEIVFFFNPFVKQLAASLRREREYSCDDMVIQFQYQPHHYAAALLTLEKNRLQPNDYGIAATGKNQQQLLIRVERLLGVQYKEQFSYRLAACLLAMLLLVFLATVKPAKSSIDKFGSAGLNLAANNITNLQYSEETAAAIKVDGFRLTIRADSNPAKNAQPSVVRPKATDRPIDLTTAPAAGRLSTVSDNTADDESVAVELATTRQDIEFSLLQPEEAAAHDPGAYPELPYVPSGSFSYQVFQDTVHPGTRIETYKEKLAKESALKAHLLLSQIDWQRIEKELKYDKAALAKIKKELFSQVNKLNWQQLNGQVQLQLNAQRSGKIQELLQQNQAIQQYRQHAAYYEALQHQLAEQQQLIKIAADNMQQSQEAARQEQSKLQLEMKKRRIIAI